MLHLPPQVIKNSAEVADFIPLAEIDPLQVELRYFATQLSNSVLGAMSQTVD